MKFLDWIAQEGLTLAAVAEQIGSDPANVRRYTLGQIPRAEVMLRIVKITDGAVTPNDFYALPERDLVSHDAGHIPAVGE